MFLMSYEVTVGAVQIKAVEKIEIDSTQATVANRAVVTCPGQEKGKQLDLESKIKRGDKVTIRLGYDGQLKTEFVGYLKTIKPNSPLQLECEDSFFLTRREIPSKVFQSTNVKKIAQYVVDSLNKELPANNKLTLITDVSGLEFEKFAIHQATGFEVLEKLRSESGLAIFMRGNDLHLHLQYKYKTGEVSYDFTRNVEDSEGLEYVRADEAKVLVKVTGKDAKGRKVVGQAGEKGGDTIQINRPTVSNEASLELVAQQILKQRQYEGYRGSLRGWLVPYCEPGYSAKVSDPDWPERAGTYYVTAVKTEFSANGGIRTVTLGIKLS